MVGRKEEDGPVDITCTTMDVMVVTVAVVAFQSDGWCVRARGSKKDTKRLIVDGLDRQMSDVLLIRSSDEQRCDLVSCFEVGECLASDFWCDTSQGTWFYITNFIQRTLLLSTPSTGLLARLPTLNVMDGDLQYCLCAILYKQFQPLGARALRQKSHHTT